MKTTKRTAGVKSVILITLAVCFLLTSLTACSGSKLSGTYKSGGLLSQSFTFSGSNNVSMSAFGLSINGTYKISGGTMTITYSLLGVSTSWDCTYKKSGNTITINGTAFTKQ